MDPQDIRSLQILAEIEENNIPSQRDLANRLDISLGLANSFIKRLVRKGYVKITTIPKNRVKYLLTPKGFAEKSRLTYEFIQYSFRFYRDALRKFEYLMGELKKQGVERVIFYGAGELAEIAFLALTENDIELIGIADDFKKGHKFLGFHVRSVRELKYLDFDRAIITNIDSKQILANNLVREGISGAKIITIDSI